jgi:hypothetical protein
MPWLIEAAREFEYVVAGIVILFVVTWLFLSAVQLPRIGFERLIQALSDRRSRLSKI